MELIYLLLKVGAVCMIGGLVLSLLIWMALSWVTGTNEQNDSDL